MKKTYKTSEVATIIGIHPNTVRLYEELEFISKPIRQQNGYRIFTDFHIEQFKLARTALEVAVLQNDLRKLAIDIIKASANCDFDQAKDMAKEYLSKIKKEQKNAEEAITIVNQLLSGDIQKPNELCLTRKQTADYLNISIDTLRNWEMNGLLHIKRKNNGYRIYTDEDIRQLKIIRSLRCANYSLSAILRMLNELSYNPQIDIKEVIDSPNQNDDIISVYDELLTSLHFAEKNAKQILIQLQKIKKEYNPNPPL